MQVRIKNAYEPPSAQDGTRILVDRIWPRGLKKTEAGLDAWVRGVAPSDGLRKWFGHDPERWTQFRQRCLWELEGRPVELQMLLDRARGKRLTLVFGAREREHNNARVMRDYLRDQLGHG